MTSRDRFLLARDILLTHRGDLSAAQRAFRWPTVSDFNWALDYFEPLAAQTGRIALRVIDDNGLDQALTYAQLATRSSQVANYLAAGGVGRGDRVLIMLGNVAPLWETMLAVIKLGAVMIPATTLLQTEDLRDRLERGAVKAIVTDARFAARFDALPGAPIRVSVGGAVAGWYDYEESRSSAPYLASRPVTRSDELLLLYFTSGTTAKPKLVAHTHASYAIGHLSTMYWIGLRPGDVHLNLSSAGWAKHAWSSFFAPWNAAATVLAYHYERFSPLMLLGQLARWKVTTFCAPPTVWRMLVQQDLAQWRLELRELVSAGEPLNPEVIEKVRSAWGLVIRDGFGQTETTALVGNPPGQPLKVGSMGRSLPGYRIALLDAEGRPGREGEICVDLTERPTGLMQAYLDDPARTETAFRDGYYHTGDVATQDTDGYLTYVGRTDDVFKSSDYRISPFELESILIEHAAVAESAVVPSPDALRLAVPKAFVVLAAGHVADADTALAIFEHIRRRVAPYKRIRRIEFAELPKTVSGKIRRVELRLAEHERREQGARNPSEFWEEDFPVFKLNHAP
jgi:acetyl-CoA synthetase